MTSTGSWLIVDAINRTLAYTAGSASGSRVHPVSCQAIIASVICSRSRRGNWSTVAVCALRFLPTAAPVVAAQ